MPENEVVLIGNYYIDAQAYGIIINNIKEKIASQNRIEARKIQRARSARSAAEKAKRRYFCNQKLYGLIILLLSVLLLCFTQDGFLFLGIAAGIYTIATKKMLIYNKYYQLHNDTKQ